MKLIDNLSEKLVDDLRVTMQRDSRVSIAAACFSVYAYEELKAQLENIDELRFLFTSPTFLQEKTAKARREFYIPRRNREKALHGSEFEIRLRNDFSQKAISRECADWIRRKVCFKSNQTAEGIPNFMTIDSAEPVTYAPVNGFTRADLGCERGNSLFTMINRIDAPQSTQYLELFNTIWNDKQRLQDVTDTVLESITTAYQENSPEFLYFFALYNIFGDFLEHVSEDDLPSDANGFKESIVWNKLYTFQKDAALAIISKLEQFNGCILADSVGLGKTFTALAVIKYYENRNLRVLVLCPKKLSDNWITYKANYRNNPLAGDRLRYDVLYHTDLSREQGFSGETDLSKLNWAAYDLVVIDESHNFRNGGDVDDDGKSNRYTKLMNKVIRPGARTRVLMLSATPVNNRFYDLRNQLALAYEGNSSAWKDKLDTNRSVEEIFRSAQKQFNAWSKLAPSQRTTEQLMRMLDFDFFEILDAVTIARSRQHIEKYYNIEEIGNFPTRLPPVTKQPPLTDLNNAITYDEIYELILSLTLSIYTPSNYILPSRLKKYADLNHEGKNSLTQAGREEGIRRLMSINLLKRLESSVHSFRLTLQRIRDMIAATLDTIHTYDPQKIIELKDLTGAADFDADDMESDLFTVGRKVKIALEDMDYLTWQRDLQTDFETLQLLLGMVADITPGHDSKLQTLLQTLAEKQREPLNKDNRKVLIFTAFSDTAQYLYEQVGAYMLRSFGLHTALVTGSVEGRSTVPKFKADLNNVLTCFSPVSKDRAALMPDGPDIDILIATDCISEGQNLQDCDCVINYDIHWNPVRLVQRFGRIDRIGSRNVVIQMINFWPDVQLDAYIDLRARVETRMKALVLSSTGDDNPLSPEEKGDLEYRREQLQRLRTEVVDLEDMRGGVSITDLGLNEFRMELLEYAKHHPELETCPGGISAVAAATPDAPPGVVFVLKNVHNEVNINDRNRLHPYYLVYLDEDGVTLHSHLCPKDILDAMRQLCRGQKQPDKALCRAFNAETDDGRKMQKYSDLLEDAVLSIVDAKADSDLDSLFRAGGTTALLDKVSGLDDFELICFVVVREGAPC
ncbi:SNF2-related protein [Gemmiger formicilis]|uniref:helicase-related protein n=1 Tax=Gemmiger formicilis TaxID=745368 RepID=UPI00210DA2DF|nr:helicase-related protein [Gemmiger formicilis]MCQ5080773.1 SNF2-related protein [Gemmiger formicilis]MCQ5117356.1 SNF2-related protein [Gemmiger formicilis]